MRLPWLWPIVIMLSALAAALVTFVFPDTAVRPLIVMWFLFICPGMMLVRFLRLREAVAEWTLALALSFAVDAMVAGLQLYAGQWSPTGTIGLLIGLSLSGALIQCVMMRPALSYPFLVSQRAVARLALLVVAKRPQAVRVRKPGVPGSIVPAYPGKRPTASSGPTKLYVFMCIFAVLCIIGAGVAVVAYQAYETSYHKYMSLAQTGVQHLKTGAMLLGELPKDPVNAQIVSQAQQEFTDAQADFVQVDHDLGPFLGMSRSLPVYGTQSRAALHLLPLAIEVSQVGVSSCSLLTLLIAKLHDPLSTQGEGITMADFSAIDKDFHQIKATLTLIVKQVNGLQASDLQLDPRLVPLVDSFHKEIPLLQVWLDDIEKLLKVLPTLLGIETPANYLIEVLDSTELRPGGGLIGNYGIATLSQGRVASIQVKDVYQFDQTFEASGHHIPYPSAYAWFDVAPEGWSLRDSNLDADFPTSAWNAEFTYMREGGAVSVQGVIAITPALVQQALAITGPIDIPEYHETITAQNLIDRIHYYELGPGREASSSSEASAQKRFTVLVAEHFLMQLRQLSPGTLLKFLPLMLDGLHSKDVQIFLNSSVAEQFLQQYHLDGSVQAPAGDSLFVVDANISRNKANQFLVNTLDDRVTLDAEGNATHHTRITYAWRKNGEVYGSPLYRDYVRVYVPPGSTLQAQDGWQPFGTSHPQTFGRQVWAGYFTLSFGQTRTITLTWTEPTVARKDASGWHYHYLLQRQAGTQWVLNQQILMPACAMITQKRGVQVADSSTGPVATLSGNLTEDMSIEIDYICAASRPTRGGP